MPLNESAIRNVHATIRACFKGQLKSSNKVYDTEFKGTPAKKAVIRNHNQERARPIVRACIDAYMRIDNLAEVGFYVLDQPKLASNCDGMTAAAIFLAVHQKIGTVYEVKIHPQDSTYGIGHVFCIVTEGQVPRSLYLRQLATENVSGWAIDPWANVCCPLRDYEQELRKTFRKWSSEGKRILVMSGQLNTCLQLDPNSRNYVDGLVQGALAYDKSDPLTSQKLPRALAGKVQGLGADAKAGKQGGSCTIL